MAADAHPHHGVADTLGKACLCFPRRMFVALIATGFVMYGAWEIMIYMLWMPITGENPVPKPCVSHECLKVFTCEGMVGSTLHFRQPYMIIGSLVFGAFGLVGSLGQDAGAARIFALWMLTIPIIFIAIFVLDLLYIGLCNAYPSNMIYTVITGWEFPDFPVDDAHKTTLRRMHTYPIKAVNQYVEMNLKKYSFVWTLIIAGIVYYWSHLTYVLSRLYVEGPVGLGVNVRLGTWRAEVLLKEYIRKMEHEAVHDAETGFEELAGDFSNDKHGGHGYGATHHGGRGSHGGHD